MRRGKLPYNKERPYSQAKEAAIKLEHRALLSIPVKFTMEEVMDQIVPPDHQKLLRAVSGLAKKHWSKDVSQSFVMGDVELRIRYDFDKTDMFPPLGLKTVFTGELKKYIDEFAATASEFLVVYGALEWANSHVGFGAMRHYWPSAVELLSPVHPAREANADRFKEPENAGQWIRDVRKAAATLASAQLLPELPLENKGNGLQINSPTSTIPVL